MKLLIATRNPDKLAEIKELFSLENLVLVSVADVPGLPDVTEDGSTFSDNALKKAVTLAKASSLWTLADDSGLEVDALNGAPGVFSARYAGYDATYADNNAKLIEALNNKSQRTARFRCVIALSDPAGNVKTVEGCCEGEIVQQPRGTEGFGYDPLFVPEHGAQTFAEMTQKQKNLISHRGKALLKAQGAWKVMLERCPEAWTP